MRLEDVKFTKDEQHDINVKIALGLMGILHERGDITDACYRSILEDYKEFLPYNIDDSE